jgi:hypothetical protein
VTKCLFLYPGVLMDPYQTTTGCRLWLMGRTAVENGGIASHKEKALLQISL